MAYRRGRNVRTGLRRRRRGNVPWYNQKYSVAQLATKAIKGVSYLKGMINCEKHYLDASASITVSYSGGMSALSYIAQGDDVNNRQGNSVLMRSLYVRGDVNLGASQTVNTVRLIFFMDKMNQGSPPTASDILQTTGTALGVSSPLNVDHTSRYKILKDLVLNVNSVGFPKRSFKVYLNLYAHAKFTGAAGSDVYKNAIWMLSISDVNTNTPSVNYNSRLGFYDN